MKRYAKLLIFISILLGFFLAAHFTPLAGYLNKDSILELLRRFQSKGWGPLAYIGLYALACAAAFPGLLLTLAGGAAFGVLKGTLYTTIAANLGATLAFCMARFLGRDFVESLLKQGSLAEKIKSLDEKASENGFRVILTLRLIPLVPFNWLNFGSGLSKIRYRDYALGSLIGMIPGTFVYIYFADSLLAGASGAGRKAYLNLALASSLLILLSFLPQIYKKFSKLKS